MTTETFRICVLAFMLLLIADRQVQAQIQIQQTPQIVIVKPNPVAAIAGALLAPISQNPNQPAAQGNNGAIPSTGPLPYPSSNGVCQPGYVFDGHGYCIVPYNSGNNLAPAASNAAPYGAQTCQPGYVPDGHGGCIISDAVANNGTAAAVGAAPSPVACPAGSVFDAQGACVQANMQNPTVQAPAPPAAPVAEDTSGTCPAGYALDHDGNCSFASETNPYKK